MYDSAGDTAMTGPSAVDLMAFLLVTTRVMAWLAISPPFNGRNVPATVKALLAAAIGLLLTPSTVAHVPSLDTASIVSAIVVQVLVGAALGFMTLVFVAAVQAAGNLIDLFGGFSLSAAYDPLSMNGNSVFGRLHQFLAAVLMLVTGAYALCLAGLSRSFDLVPLDGSVDWLGDITEVGGALGAMFLAAVQLAAPLIGVMFLADVGLGLMTRIAPALNAFSLGFPLKIMVVLVLVGFTFPLLPSAVTSLVTDGVTAGLTLIGG